MNHKYENSENITRVSIPPQLRIRNAKCTHSERGKNSRFRRDSNGRNRNNHLSVIKLRNINDRRSSFVKFSWILSIIVQIILSTNNCRASNSLSDQQLIQLARDRSRAAEKWAPLIFLHPEERYFPTAVHSFLKNIIPREMPSSQKISEPPVIISMSRSLGLDSPALPEGPAGEDTYLFAPINIECRHCQLPRFLYGDEPSSEYSPPIYATISSCLPTYKRSYRRSRHYSSLRPPPPPPAPTRRRFWKRKRSSYYKRRAKRSNHYLHQNYYSSPNRGPRYSVVRKRDARMLTENWLDIEPESHNLLYEEGEDFSERSRTKISSQSSGNKIINLPSSTLLPPKDTSELNGSDTLEENFWKEILEDSSSVQDLFNQTEYDQGTEQPLTTNDLEGSASEPPEVGGSNYTYYNEEKIRVTRNPESSSNPNIKHQTIEYHDKDDHKVKKLRGHKYTVTYWMFYPFSQGKKVCTSRFWIIGRVFKPRIRNKCFGDAITLNSHVGDWEHISIHFEDNIPRLMYVSMHTYGAYYAYNRRKHIFVYRGRDTRLGIPLKPNYPPVVKMDGTHPILYSALGSHGLWAGPGIHRYEKLLPLDDKTARGTPWKSWKNIDIIDYREPEYSRPDRQWLQFYGRWGNPSKSCHRGLFGICDLASGPTGIPLKRPNFPCHMPYHSTFFPED